MKSSVERPWTRLSVTRRSAVSTLTGGVAALALALAGRPRAAAAAADKVVRVGVQKYGTLVILRERGALAPALAKLGWRVAWTEFPAGPQMLEALNVGDLDFGTTGEAPPVFAQAAGAPLVYVGTEPPPGEGNAILVPQASRIQSIAELKGKRIALNKGSNVHYLLVQALKSAGLGPADIQPIYLVPADARAAFEQGAVDAWAIWDPFLAAAQAATHARVLVDAKGLAPNRQFFLASRNFAEQQPALLRTLLAEIETTDHWAQQHQDDVAAILSKNINVPAPVLKVALGRMGYGVGPITPQVVADQQRIADTFHELKLIPVPVRISEALWSPPA